jgi:hypothetical protein
MLQTFTSPHENIQKYKKSRTNINKAVSGAMGQTYVELYRKLDTKEDKNDVYKMAKFWERKTNDFNQVKCIKDMAHMILMKDDEIKNGWRKYFDKLFNE